MLRDKLCNIFHKVQQNSSCHQKYREILRNVYNRTHFEDFEIEFMRCLNILFLEDVMHKNVHVERSLEFAATFVTSLIARAENHNGSDSRSSPEEEEEDLQTHPFLNVIIRNVLEYHQLDNISPRYRTCQFIDLLLRNIGEDAHIENDLWNVILESLLKRIKDIKPVVRLQAVRALARLQSPIDSECPVIEAFLGRMYDCSPMVRKEIVELIAPSPLTSSKIVEKVRDSDHTVRLAAYRKCSKMGPKMVKLLDRQSVVVCGFNEMHENVKMCFLEDTLPKWLNAYNGDFLKLLYALKVDAFAEDMEQTAMVCKNVLEVFFKTHQLTSIMEYLPIDENKVIPLQKLNYESVLYWCILVNYLHKSDGTEDYLENIIPELVTFCDYIKSIAKENSHLIEGWKYDEYQHILHQLFQIVGKYDLGDEVGRRALRTLIVSMLTTAKLDIQIITEILSILEKMNPVLDSLTIDICSIISDIRVPLVVQQPSEYMLQQHEFNVAEVKVEINRCSFACDEAVKVCDYEKAALCKKELEELNKKLKNIIEQFESGKTIVRTSQNNPETLCRCLDILIGMLSHSKLKTLTVSLRTCSDEFVKPLCQNNNPEISWRVYKCIALYCTLDRQFTQESLKLICSPIIFYRLTAQDENDKQILLISISAVSDILRLYGTDIFGPEDNNTTSSNSTLRRRFNGTRRLYTSEQIDDADNFDFASVTWKDVIDILLDMLDDERRDVREQAGRGICELVMDKIAVSSELLARLILKWFNPLTEKHDQKLQVLLGNTFVLFAQMSGTEEIIEQSVIPVLSHIGNAPHTSPLVDVDLDNALRFLSAITSIQRQEDSMVDSHKNLAYALCYKINAKPDDRCVPLYIKMLLLLELFLEDSVIIKELINQAELALEDIIDKAPKRNIQKFVFKLNKLLSACVDGGGNEMAGDKSLATEVATSSETTSRNSVIRQTVMTNKPNTMPTHFEEIQNAKDCVNKRKSGPLKSTTTTVEDSIRQNTRRLSNISVTEKSPVKRRKQRGRRSKGASIDGNESDITVLHTIIENEEILMGSLEDDDLSIQTPTTSDSPSNMSSTEKQGRPKKVLPENLDLLLNNSSGSTSSRGRPKKGTTKNLHPSLNNSNSSGNVYVRLKRFTTENLNSPSNNSDSGTSTGKRGRPKRNPNENVDSPLNNSNSGTSTSKRGRPKSITNKNLDSRSYNSDCSISTGKRGRPKRISDENVDSPSYNSDSSTSTGKQGRPRSITYKNLDSPSYNSDSSMSTGKRGRPKSISNKNVDSPLNNSDSSSSTGKRGRPKRITNKNGDSPSNHSDSDTGTDRRGRPKRIVTENMDSPFNNSNSGTRKDRRRRQNKLTSEISNLSSNNSESRENLRSCRKSAKVIVSETSSDSDAPQRKLRKSVRKRKLKIFS